MSSMHASQGKLRARSGVVAVGLVAALVFVAASSSCVGDEKQQRRARSVSHDADCRSAERPTAFIYPSTNREFGLDDPARDNCELLVPDHLFCCPSKSKPTDR